MAKPRELTMKPVSAPAGFIGVEHTRIQTTKLPRQLHDGCRFIANLAQKTNFAAAACFGNCDRDALFVNVQTDKRVMITYGSLVTQAGINTPILDLGAIKRRAEARGQSTVDWLVASTNTPSDL
jgi:hypothetical protein